MAEKANSGATNMIGGIIRSIKPDRTEETTVQAIYARQAMHHQAKN